MISATDLILVAFFTGIGNSLGQPIGKWIYKKINGHIKVFKKIAIKNIK
jgi:hypothetical protein